MVYFDNAAAASPDKKSLEFFVSRAAEYFANQESAHSLGYSVKKYLEGIEYNLNNILLSNASSDDFEITEQGISGLSIMKNDICRVKDISNNIPDHESTISKKNPFTQEMNYGFVWTETATSAINLLAYIPELQNREIITTKAEHPAILQVLKKISDINGVKIRFVKLCSNGLIDIDHFCEILKLCPYPPVVALHHVHNETGVVQRLISLSDVITDIAPETKVIVDTVQSVGKLSIPWIRAKIDYAFISGYKIGLPFGGVLIFRKNKRNSNTELFKKLRKKQHFLSRVSTPIASTVVFRIETLYKNLEYLFEKIVRLNTLFRLKLKNAKINSEIVFPVDYKFTSPYILNFLVSGYQANVLVRMLSQKGVMISAGSACNSETDAPSETLMAMGISKKNAFSALRVSFDENNTEEEIDIFVEILNDAILHY